MFGYWDEINEFGEFCYPNNPLRNFAIKEIWWYLRFDSRCGGMHNRFYQNLWFKFYLLTLTLKERDITRTQLRIGQTLKIRARASQGLGNTTLSRIVATLVTSKEIPKI